jgi:hypothetical protein
MQEAVKLRWECDDLQSTSEEHAQEMRRLSLLLERIKRQTGALTDSMPGDWSQGQVKVLKYAHFCEHTAEAHRPPLLAGIYREPLTWQAATGR